MARLEPYVLKGVFQPAPRARRLVVERRSGRGWRRAGLVHTTRQGRYRVRLARSGIYRVRHGGVAGPGVRLR
jgi:hypothetical protein